MLGGFLGAGKTTTVLRVARYFQNLGKRVGLITNDQAAGLVDTALLEELQLPVREIAGGCFCCKSEGLVEALERHTSETQPEVFIAEPVGSCTDLIATVSLPLARIYQQGYVMAPYAVLVDPYRAMQSLGVEGKPLFSPDVNYIYRKQLEEAEIICINKVDVLEPDRLAKLRSALELEYPEARIIEMSSRQGQGMELLFEALATTKGRVSKVMEVDYARYGVGEALLGWVNMRVQVEYSTEESICPKEDLKTVRKRKAAGSEQATQPEGARSNWSEHFLLSIVEEIQKTLQRRKVEIAHLKVSLAQTWRDDSAPNPKVPIKSGKLGKGRVAKHGVAADVGSRGVEAGGQNTPAKLAAVQLVHSAHQPEVTRRMQGGFTNGELLINLRAEGDPELLSSSVEKALAKRTEAMPGVNLTHVHLEHFRPGQPKPTHRVGKV